MDEAAHQLVFATFPQQISGGQEKWGNNRLLTGRHRLDLIGTFTIY